MMSEVLMDVMQLTFTAAIYWKPGSRNTFIYTDLTYVGFTRRGKKRAICEDVCFKHRYITVLSLYAAFKRRFHFTQKLLLLLLLLLVSFPVYTSGWSQRTGYFESEEFVFFLSECGSTEAVRFICFIVHKFSASGVRQKCVDRVVESSN